MAGLKVNWQMPGIFLSPTYVTNIDVSDKIRPIFENAHFKVISVEIKRSFKYFKRILRVVAVVMFIKISIGNPTCH